MKFFLPCIIVVLTDQITKHLVSRFIPFNSQLNVIGDFLKITFTLNPGAIFGFSVGPYFLYIVGVACIFLLIFTIRKRSILFSIILGGAIGNLIDRIRLGAVIDFIDINVGSFHWPTFNIADSCITIGVILLLLNILNRKAYVE